MSTRISQPRVTESQRALLARLVGQGRVTIEELVEARVGRMSRPELAAWVASVDFPSWTLNGQRMSRSDHALLQVFVEHAGEVVTKRELWFALWGYHPQSDYGRETSRALGAAVSRLRRKGVPLVNVWGVGWLLPEGSLVVERLP